MTRYTCVYLGSVTIVLDELVLEVAARHRDNVLAQPPDPDYNRDIRHTAHRQYILWRHGYLGAGKRRVVLSCCVWRIRGKFALGQKLKCWALLSTNIPLKKHLTNPAVLLIYV
jgi:hypothetical protein